MYGVYVDVFTDHKSLQYAFTQKRLNLQHTRWLEFLQDYDMSVLYNPDKDNLVADAISRMTMGSVSHIYEAKKHLGKEVHRFARFWVEVGRFSKWWCYRPS